MAVPGCCFQCWIPQFKRDVGTSLCPRVWHKDTKMTGAYEERLRDVGLLEMGSG